MTPPGRRILMNADAVGGVWVYATSLARALCKRGEEVTLLVMGPAPRCDQLEPLRHVPGLRIEITDLALEWMDPEGTDVARASDCLRRIAQRIKPDVVHLNSYREASFDWPAPVVLVAHSCVWSWWEACRGGAPDEPRWHNYADAVAAGLTAADAWAAPTAAFRDWIAQHYRPQARGRVIPNGADQAAANAAKEPFVLAAGRLWDEGKNLAALHDVAAELEWPLRIAGPTQAPDGRGWDSGFAGSRCLGVLSHPEMLATMQRAAIFASPALYEPFGLSVLEAAGRGCALVLSDIAGFRELWGGAALFVPVGDRHAWKAALQRVSREDRLRVHMQAAARTRARRYLLDDMVKSYRELYRDMAEGAPMPDSPSRMQRAHAEELPA